MNIGIIGAGNIGGTLARALAAAGHDVFVGARDQAKLSTLAAEAGVEVGTANAAARFGEAVIVAAPYGAWPELGRDLGDVLAGKIVIDAANPYPDRDGAMAGEALARGSGLTTAGLLPGARLVRTFNTLYWKDLAGKAGSGLGMALAGDDSSAVEMASRLVRDVGFEPVVAGGIAAAARFDPGARAYGAALPPTELRALLTNLSSDATA